MWYSENENLNANGKNWWKTFIDNPLTNPYGTYMYLSRGGKTSQDVEEDARDLALIKQLEAEKARLSEIVNDKIDVNDKSSDVEDKSLIYGIYGVGAVLLLSVVVVGVLFIRKRRHV